MQTKTSVSPQRSLSGALLALKLVLKNLFGRLKIRRKNTAQAFHALEYRVFSQHREDGIIDHLLDQVGEESKSFVEFGFAPHECNCLNLVLNRGYSGLFIDGSSENCTRASDAYSWLGKHAVKIANTFLTSENINQVILENGISGPIDLLSVDIDGNDYWLWSAIDVVNPKIVVAEYNASFGPSMSVTVPYDPAFVRYDKHPSGFYHGVSLQALVYLGAEKGYRLVGCDYTGVNAFFVRNDLKCPELPTMTAEQAFMPNRGRVKYKGVTTDQQFERIRDMPFVEIKAAD